MVLLPELFGGHPTDHSCRLFHRSHAGFSHAVNSVPPWLAGITQDCDDSELQDSFLHEACPEPYGPRAHVSVCLPPDLAWVHLETTANFLQIVSTSE